MIEKIPMVIPEIVNADRSLLAPSELHAIWMISSVSMGRLGVGGLRLAVRRRPRTRRRPRPRLSVVCFYFCR